MKNRWNNGQMRLTDKDCIAYFRERPVFDRVLRGFSKKYESYGSFAGTVRLRNLSLQDIEDLEGFFQKSFHGQKSVTVSAVQFEKALQNSRFAEMDPKTLLEFYFQEAVIGRKEKQEAEKLRWLRCFESTKRQFAKTPAEAWFDDILKMEEAVPLTKCIRSYILNQYRESGSQMEEVSRILRLGAQMVNRFPFRQGNKEYLAVFAAMITGNPHAFDDGTKDGQLLYLTVQWAVDKQGFKLKRSDLFPALQKQRYFLAVGILRDDVSNYAMVCGVHVWKEAGLHPGVEGFLQEGEAVQAALSVIAEWERIACPHQEIYIVENPSVYAMLCKAWKGERACMCMNGQPRLSSLLVLDLLAAAGTKVYYAGDFDPEGLLIAQKLKQYYRGSFSYWHMSASEYESSRSDKKLSERRLKMLAGITDPALQQTAMAVRDAGAAGYQENIWEMYLQG